MPIGLICSIFTTIILILICCFNNKTKKIFSCYWFYSILGFIFLVYFIVFRWTKELLSWINNDDRNLFGGMDVIISKVLLLDMCPFNVVALCIFMIFDKKREILSLISPFGIIGGAITVYGQISTEGIGSPSFSWVSSVGNIEWWQYIFLNQLYFIMHFFLLVISTIVFLNSKGFNWLKIINTHVYAVVFFTYISCVVIGLDIKWNATGIVANDWSKFGEYSTIGSMLSFLKFPEQPIVVFIFVWLIILIMIWLRNLMVIDMRYNQKDIVISKQAKQKYLKFIYHNK